METGIDDRLIGFAIALGIGLIVGLQREWEKDKPVGLRSFALISTLGGLAALMAEKAGGWVVAAGLLGLAILVAVQVIKQKPGGVTTLVATLVIYLVGAAAVAGYWVHAIVIGGLVTALLHWRRPLHGIVDRLGRQDLEIIARFVLISLVILPVLPNRTYGPYDVFNPFNAWLLVVLIVSINLVGYTAFRLLGERSGSWAAGILGGMVSSTATTISYASMTRRQEDLGRVAALVILLASVVVYARIILELSVVSRGLVQYIVTPSLVFGFALLVLCFGIDRRQKSRGRQQVPERKNPAEFRMALGFAAIYVVILFAVAAARDWFSEDAIYAVAFISGLTDVDALTLSVGKLHSTGQISDDLAWRSIFLGSLSNLLFKVVAAGLLGSALLRRWIWSCGAVALLAGSLVLGLWPDSTPLAALLSRLSE